MPHPNKWRGSLDLERKIKLNFLLPTLLLQKSPSINGMKGHDLLPIIQRQMKQYNGGNWVGLIVDYEHNVMLAQKMHICARLQTSCPISNAAEPGSTYSQMVLATILTMPF
jgi:hypothetical protein